MNYEDFLELAQSRRSIRKFAQRPVPRKDLERLLEAARWAPSNHNRQPWKFIILEDHSQIVQLADRVGTALSDRLKSLPSAASSYAGELARYATFFAGAPVLMIVFHKPPVSFSQALLKDLAQPVLVSGEPLSAAMAVQNLLLAAQALGLGACVLTAPLIVPEAISRELKLAAGHELTCMVALGYADEQPSPPRRKSIEQIAEFRQADTRLETTR